MNLVPMKNVRPGQLVQCVECHKLAHAEKAVLDLDGVPYKAYYHDACVPVNGFLFWQYVERRDDYYFWKHEDKDGRDVFQCTTDPKPPKNDAGYLSFSYLLRVKGL